MKGNTTNASYFKRKINKFAARAAVFRGWWDVLKSMYVKGTPVAFPKLVGLTLKESVVMLCRPRTSDLGTLFSCFQMGYHLPPREIARRDAVILDLGANVGYTVADFALRYPDARIIAVEMDGANCELAAANVSRFGSRCVLLHAAVWTEEGEVCYEGGEADAFHISSGSGNGFPKVPSRTIAGILEQFGIAEVDYLKMDIEGAEAEVIVTAREWAPKVRMMNIEVHSPEIMATVVAHLEEFGFQCEPSTSHWSSIMAIRNDGPDAPRNATGTL